MATHISCAAWGKGSDYRCRSVSRKKVLLERGFSPDPGARPLERAVDEWVVQPLVDAWFDESGNSGRVRFTAAVPAQSSPRDLPDNVTVLGGARGSAGIRGASSSAATITFSQE